MNRKHNNGFSLIELMVTLAVLAIAASLVAPSMGSLIKSNRVTTATNDLIGAIQYARAEASVRGYPVTLCNADAAFKNCSAKQSWNDGWVVVLNRGQPGQELLRAFPKSADTVDIQSPSDQLKNLVFQPNGSIKGFLAGSGVQTFTVKDKECGSGKEHVRLIQVTFLGQTKSKRQKCS